MNDDPTPTIKDTLPVSKNSLKQELSGLALAPGYDTDVASDSSDDRDDLNTPELQKVIDLYPGLVEYIESVRELAHNHLQLHPEHVSRDKILIAAKRIVEEIKTALKTEYSDATVLDRLDKGFEDISQNNIKLNEMTMYLYPGSSIENGLIAQLQQNEHELKEAASEVDDESSVPEWVAEARKFFADCNELSQRLADDTKAYDRETKAVEDDRKVVLSAFFELSSTYDDSQFSSFYRKVADLMTSIESLTSKRSKVADSAGALRSRCDSILSKMPKASQ